MTSLNYNHLRYFWAVAHDGNLTRTAEKLNVSQSALSLQIKKLEERLGQQLFERRGKQLVLTEAGGVALDHADVIFAAGEELLGTLMRRDVDRDRLLRVGALSTLSRNFQIQFLQPLINEDGARISVRSGSIKELLALLKTQKLDVVLTNQSPVRDADTPWLIHSIAEQTVSLVGYPERAKKKRSLKTLLETERLIVPNVDSSVRLGFDALVDELRIRPNIFIEVDDMALLRVFAREDVGLAIVPPIVVKDELSSGRLVEIEKLPRLRETFYAVTVARRFPHPALGSLLSNTELISGAERE
ncbi:MAG: LysR family transcriptional regulator [Pseudomonadota bacterium]